MPVRRTTLTHDGLGRHGIWLLLVPVLRVFLSCILAPRICHFAMTRIVDALFTAASGTLIILSTVGLGALGYATYDLIAHHKRLRAIEAAAKAQAHPPPQAAPPPLPQ